MKTALALTVLLMLPACPEAYSVSPAQGAQADDAGSSPTDGGTCGACPSGLACDAFTAECTQVATLSLRMRDGVTLWTRVFLPDSVPPGGVPTLLHRTPYLNLSGGIEAIGRQARFHTARGYAYVLQSLRGRYGSGGAFAANLVRPEIEDGQDTSRWIGAQPWSNGRIGTLGCSYDGFTAVAAAVGNPYVVAIVQDDSIEDLRNQLNGGTPSLWYLNWIHVREHGKYPEVSVVAQATNALEAGSLDVLLAGQADGYWQEVVSAETAGRLPDDRSLAPHHSRVCAPHLAVRSGLIHNDGLHLWQGIRGSGCEEQRDAHELILTPEEHCYHSVRLGRVATPVTQRMLEFIDAHVGQRGARAPPPPVTIAFAEGEEYRGVADWPVPGQKERVFFLGGGGALGNEAPVQAAPDSLSVDPVQADPCAAGYPYRAYLSAPLVDDLLLAGPPLLELYVATSTPDGDVFASLYEVPPGVAPKHVVAFGSQRLRFRKGAASVPMPPGVAERVRLGDAAKLHRFARGSRVALVLSPGRCGYLENPHTGEPLAQQTQRLAAEYQYLHDTQHPSRLVLPLSD